MREKEKLSKIIIIIKKNRVELIDTVSHLHFTDVLDTTLGSLTFVESSENTVYYLLSRTGQAGQRLNAESGARDTINGQTEHSDLVRIVRKFLG